MASFLYKVGSFCYRKWWMVLSLWIVALVGIGIAGSSLSEPFKDDFNLPGSQAVKAQEVLQKNFPQTAETQAPTATVVFQSKDGQRLDQGHNATAINTVVAKLREVPQLPEAERAALTNPAVGAAAAENLSGDGRVAQLRLTFDGVKTVSQESKDAVAAAKQAGADAGLTVETAGAANEHPAEPPAEMIGIVVAVIVMIITFAALLAALMPLVSALIGIALSTSVIAIGTSFLTLGTSTTGLSMMIGLAVGIDYSLFVISRYRQELLRTDDRAHAAGLAVGTAGSAVVFAGATVIIALCGLSITGMSFLSQMGLGAAVTVALAVLVALTVLPALLGVFKSAVFTPRLPFLWTPDQTERRPMGQRIGELLTKRPLPFLIGAVAVLAVAAIPIGKIELGLDVTSPSDKAATSIQSEAFGAGKSSPLVAVIDDEGKGDRKAAETRFADEVRKLDGLGPGGIIGPVPNATGNASQFIIVPASGPSTKQTADLLAEVRDHADAIGTATGTYVGIGGAAAINADFSDALTSKLPLYLIVVVGLAIILLMIVFRSVIIPVIASLGFLLSIAATFGVTVGFFQEGWLGWISPEEGGPILVFMPIFLIGIVFGLAMDYQVFLVSRMREEHHHGAEAQEAIRIGYSSGARVVTAAAIIMISVFAGFTLSTETFLKLMGFSMAAAIVFDAFLVRMIIMPTTMSLLGEKAWWMPRWLDRILPRIDVEGDALRTADADAPVAEHETEEIAAPARVAAAAPPAPAPAPAPRKPAPALQGSRNQSVLDELRASNRALVAELSELRSDYRSIAAHTRLQAGSVVDPVRFESSGTAGPGPRTGTLHTPHGTVETPAFVALAPLAAAPGIDPASIGSVGAQAITVDGVLIDRTTGAELIDEAGGLHGFARWDVPLFVDVSGVADPAAALAAAHRLGGDIAFGPAGAAIARRALAEHNWLSSTRSAGTSLWPTLGSDADASAVRELQQQHDEDRASGGLGFGGYRILGAAGTAPASLIGELDSSRPRYLSGARGPADLFAAVDAGVDLVDSAAPLELARHGIVLTTTGPLAVSAPQHRGDTRPLDPAPEAWPAPGTTPMRAYLHHLYRVDPVAATAIAARHNTWFLTTLVARMRDALIAGRYPAFQEDFLGRYGAAAPGTPAPRRIPAPAIPARTDADSHA
ncbi:tRNA-guanine transglycosylase [Tsukamurella strandjordii]|uniref:tRNA-guanine transglycosylase n=1 Tax=Tsukamurella strandjordii TaxID=147577 RepID=UPI0031E15B4B